MDELMSGWKDKQRQIKFTYKVKKDSNTRRKENILKAEGAGMRHCVQADGIHFRRNLPSALQCPPSI